MNRPIFGLILSLFLLVSIYSTSNSYYPSVIAAPVKNETKPMLSLFDENANGKFDFLEKITSFSGIAYFDENANGKQDVGEKGMPGVQIYISDSNTYERTFVNSSIDGTYAFHNFLF